MGETRFSYTTYIRATPQQLWDALTKPNLQEQYWFGMRQESDWAEGAPWVMKYPDGRIANDGTILSAEPTKSVAIAWRNRSRPEMAAEGDSRCSYEIGAEGETSKLTIRHDIPVSDSKLIGWVSASWPMALSSLKSFVEYGLALPRPQS